MSDFWHHTKRFIEGAATLSQVAIKMGAKSLSHTVHDVAETIAHHRQNSALEAAFETARRADPLRNRRNLWKNAHEIIAGDLEYYGEQCLKIEPILKLVADNARDAIFPAEIPLWQQLAWWELERGCHALNHHAQSASAACQKWLVKAEYALIDGIETRARMTANPLAESLKAIREEQPNRPNKILELQQSCAIIEEELLKIGSILLEPFSVTKLPSPSNRVLKILETNEGR